MVGNLLLHLLEVARAAEDAGTGIGPLRHFHVRGRIFRELHDADGPVRRTCRRIPLGFLVADGGEQPPILTHRHGRRLEPLAQHGQAALDVAHDAARTHEAQLLAAPVVAFHDLAEIPAHGHAREILAHLVHEAVIARGEHPGELLLAGEVEGNVQLRIRIPCLRELVGIRDGEVDLAGGDPLQQLERLGVAVLDPGQVGNARTLVAQVAGMRAAGGHLQVMAAHIGERAGLEVAAPVDEVLADALVDRTGDQPPHRLVRHHERSRGDVGMTILDLGVDVRELAPRSDPELHAQILREALHQLELRSFRLIVRTAEEGIRAVAGDHPQFTQLLDLGEEVRGRGTGG
ncbi:MAG: hypothetical protein U1F35_07615 [Steroidobacteraceae bacterium]